MIKPFKIRQSKIDLNSTAGNHLCGMALGNLPYKRQLSGVFGHISSVCRGKVKNRIAPNG